MAETQELKVLLHKATASTGLSKVFSTQKGLLAENNEISAYSGETVSVEIVQSEVKKLKAAFPEITADFLMILIDRLIDNQFTKERVRDAINNIIDNSPFKRPAIADIISFDRKVKLFTFKEIEAKCSPGYLAFEHHERVIIQGKAKYIEL